MQSEQINELAAALAKAQAEMPPAELDKVNPHFKSPYSSLNAVWAACREPLSKNGLAVIQAPETLDGRLVLKTALVHSSGQFYASYLPINADKLTMQGMGSALTYAKRYALMAMVGVSSDEDDDGEAAEKEGKQKNDSKAPSSPIQPQREPSHGDLPSNRMRDDRPVSEAQVKRLHALRNKAGIDEAALKEMIAKRFQVDSASKLGRDAYNAVCDYLIKVAEEKK